MMSSLTGRKITLPTEAEWEYVCRAGTESEFGSGDGARSLNDTGWYAANSANRTKPIRTKTPNQWGLYDLHGSVWEWCQDSIRLYNLDDQTDPICDPYEFERTSADKELNLIFQKDISYYSRGMVVTAIHVKPGDRIDEGTKLMDIRYENAMGKGWQTYIFRSATRGTMSKLLVKNGDTVTTNQPVVVLNCINRAVRGGSWNSEAQECRSISRMWFRPEDRANNLGLRVCLRVD